jgi:hypothetical protein
VSITRFLVMLLILPLGWTLGMLIALAWVGREMVEPPVFALPLGTAAAIALAFMPFPSPIIRLAVMAVATVCGMALLFGMGGGRPA